MFRLWLRIACSFAVLGGWSGALASPVTPELALRQVAGILEYIAGDYRMAVSAEGQVLQPGEYDEQRSLADEAVALGDQAQLAPSDALRGKLGALRQALHDKRSPSQVGRLCEDARALIVQQHGVTLSPTTTPSREQAARLYVEQGCANCHGADGSANTAAAQQLTPRPANFLDPARVATVSAHRAFHAVSFGVPGTGMLAYPKLSDAQRWSLAFYVLSLRHAHEDLAAGKRLLQRSAAELPTSAAGLAAMTDEDILRALGSFDATSERGLVLGYLRAQAPFEASATTAGTRLAHARQLLHAGLLAYRAGDGPTARRELVAAYLDGFEPHEAAIAARDRGLVREIERAMLSLRQAAARGEPVAQVDGLARHVEALLSRAEGGGSATTAFFGALTIAVREGLEITLLIAALLGLVRKRGLPELVKYVHAGWLLAASGGLVTWWAVGELLSGLQRELAEGIATLVAAVVLLGVTHWLLGQLSAKRFMGFVARGMGSAAASPRAALGILGLSFIAAYREAFEIVLFFKALLLDAGESQGRVWLGAAVGLASLVLLTFWLKRLGQRLQPRPFMLASSALLGLLVFALTGNGVHSLQEAGVLGLSELAFPELPWLGIYGSAQSLGAQALVLVFLLGSAMWPWLARRGDDSAQPAQ
jgi:high-affinity iron transporter